MITVRPSTGAQDLPVIAKRVASHFPGRSHRYYARWKLQSDPLYETVFTTLLPQPSLPVLDIGCGVGLLAFYLRERGLSMPLHGMDFDVDKITLAQTVARAYPPTPEFHHGDTDQPWPDCQGHVCLLDVLQYLPVAHQKKLLGKSVQHVAPDGLLVIRSGLQSSHWRYRITEFIDRLMNLLQWMKSPPVAYPTRSWLEQTILNHGMRLLDCRPLNGRTPFNNYLLVFQRSDTGRTQR